ncbi:MAG TPA: hypothetical protein VF753_04635 [Terriglobales bacterium]
MAQPDSMDFPRIRAAANAAGAIDISLIRGGPFYRAQQLTRLIDANRWNLGRRIIFAIAVGWLPLVLMTLFFHPSALRNLLTDYRVNARLLVAVPVLLAGQVVMESRFRTIVQHLRDCGILDANGITRLDSIIASLSRWRDSIWPELCIVALVYLNVWLVFTAHVNEARPWALVGEGAGNLLPAGWYYAIVSQLIYQFLVGLSLWKWLLWSYFLFRLSGMDLRLVVTHPDEHAGTGFLGLSPMGNAPLAFAVTAAIGSNWRHQILDRGLHLVNFKIDAIVLLMLVLLVGVGPLVFFVPRLAKLRRKGILEYGTLGQLHSTDFHEKWILHRAGHESEFLTAPEISALTDYASSYEKIEQMQPFPVDKGALLALALAVAIPLFPVVLAEIPLGVVLKALLDAAK